MQEEKLSCAIVRDLLPLYNDGMLEKESADAVEVHVKSCKECAAMLEKLNRPLLDAEKISEPQKMPSAEKVLKETKHFSFKRGILIASVVGAVLVGMFVMVFCPIWKTPEDTFRIIRVYRCENEEDFAETFQTEKDSAFAEEFVGDEPYRFAVLFRKEQYSGAHKAMEQDGDTVIIRETYPLYKAGGSHPVVEEMVSFAVDSASEIRKIVYNGKEIWNIEKDGQPEMAE